MLQLQKIRDNVESLLLTPISLKKPVVTVDYPKQAETVMSPTYTFRFTVRALPEHVDVSIDRGAWEPCRLMDQNWWYDWSHYAPGSHQLIVRATMPGGKVILSSVCRFKVHLS